MRQTCLSRNTRTFPSRSMQADPRGLKAGFEGTVNIGNSDVEASAKLDEAQAKELVDHQVCVVTMAPIVNNDVKEGGVEDLTKQQLIDIFTGKTTNWKEVGGPTRALFL